jgi:dUTPase
VSQIQNKAKEETAMEVNCSTDADIRAALEALTEEAGKVALVAADVVVSLNKEERSAELLSLQKSLFELIQIVAMMQQVVVDDDESEDVVIAARFLS